MALKKKPEHNKVLVQSDRTVFFSVFEARLPCTHAVLQHVLQSVQDVVVVDVEQLLQSFTAEHVGLVDVHQLPDLHPANHTLRRQQQDDAALQHANGAK